MDFTEEDINTLVSDESKYQARLKELMDCKDALVAARNDLVQAQNLATEIARVNEEKVRLVTLRNELEAREVASHAAIRAVRDEALHQATTLLRGAHDAKDELVRVSGQQAAETERIWTNAKTDSVEYVAKAKRELEMAMLERKEAQTLLHKLQAQMKKLDEFRDAWRREGLS